MHACMSSTASCLDSFQLLTNLADSKGMECGVHECTFVTVHGVQSNVSPHTASYVQNLSFSFYYLFIYQSIWP